MSDLVEFLLARIAEDERDAAARDAEVERWPSADWDESRSKRAHAECEAKRRIVQLHTPSADHAEGHCPTCWNDEGGRCDTVRLLAMPYADHPDYRPEWRL